MVEDLSAALMNTQVAEIGARFLTGEFGARSALLVADEHVPSRRLCAGFRPSLPSNRRLRSPFTASPLVVFTQPSVACAPDFESPPCPLSILNISA